MNARRLQLPLALLLALGVVTGAAAQSASRRGDQTVLPVWNDTSGKFEAYLVLEPTEDAETGARFRFGNTSLDTTFGLQEGDSLALLCKFKNGVGSGIGSLANNCLLASLGDGLDADAGSRHVSATAALSRGGGKLGLNAGSGHDTLPPWLMPGVVGQGKADIRDLGVFAQKNIGSQGYVSIAGTVAKARLIPAAEAPAFADRWSSKTITVGGGIGAFGANFVGHVIDTPGQPKFQALGLGLTWRTPWSGQLTVGADNVVTRGKNPFSTSRDDAADEGTVPYVRYEQDL
jgi:hypothetical protein